MHQRNTRVAAAARNGSRSCGVLLYVLLGGYLPYPAANEEAMVDMMRERDASFHQGYWEGVSDEAKSLVARLLVRDPAARVSAADALDADWFKLDVAELEGTALRETHGHLKKAHMNLRNSIGDDYFGSHVHDEIESRRGSTSSQILEDEVEVEVEAPPPSPSKRDRAKMASEVKDAVLACLIGCGEAMIDETRTARSASTAL